MLRQFLGFVDDGIFTARGNCAPFVNGNGTKITLAITAAMGGNGKADRFKRFYRSDFFIEGMLFSFKIKGVNKLYAKILVPARLNLKEAESKVSNGLLTVKIPAVEKNEPEFIKFDIK